MAAGLKVNKGLGPALDGRNSSETADINKYNMRAVTEAASFFCESACSGSFLCNPIGVVTTSAQIKPRRRVWVQEDRRSIIRLIKC